MQRLRHLVQRNNLSTSKFLQCLAMQAPFVWAAKQDSDELDCLSATARKQELKQAVRKASTMDKVQQLLEESDALASINPAKQVSYQYSDYTAELRRGKFPHHHEQAICTTCTSLH